MLRRSSVILFSQTFPFEQGEEFLEAELPHVVEAFDQVIVVPTLYAVGMAQTRALPPGVTLVTAGAPHARQALLVAGFCARHPLDAIRSLARSLDEGRTPRQVWTDIKFDLHAAAVARSVASAIAEALADVDEAVFYGFWLHTPARVALETRRLLGFEANPAVSRANGFDLYHERHADNYLPQRDRLLSGLDQVFAASSSAEQYLWQRYPKHRAKFTTDRIGTPPAINPGNPSRSRQHVVSCSYIAPVKRLTMLIDDIAEAQTSRAMPLTWTHIGSGPDAYTAEVMAYASHRLHPGSFQFLGHMANHDIREWYAENPASAFVHVSESEGGLAAAIQEALAQGLPVIATKVGGVSAMKQDPDLFDGLLDLDHTPVQFADRLEALLSSDDETYSSYVAASMAFWRTYCSADILASAFARRLRRIAAGFPGKAESGTSLQSDGQIIE